MRCAPLLMVACLLHFSAGCRASEEPTKAELAEAWTDTDIDKKYPLGDQLQVLAEDAQSEAYRKLVAGMNGPDLSAEWTRVETLDNPESFLKKHGGKETVLGDASLKRGYYRQIAIREK